MPKAKRKNTKKLATEADYAKQAFKPWKPIPGLKPGELFPSDQTVQRFTVSGRAAYAIMLKSKKECMAMYRPDTMEALNTLFFTLGGDAKGLRDMARMMEGAQLRMIVSAAASERAKKRGRK